MIKVSKELSKALINEFGTPYQLDKVIEECAELTLALIHYKEDKCTLEHLLGEIVDVSIVIDQATIIFGEELINDMKIEKINQIEKMIESRRSKDDK